MLSQQTFCISKILYPSDVHLCSVLSSMEMAHIFNCNLVLHSWESRSWTLTHILDFSHAQCLKIPNISHFNIFHEKNYIFNVIWSHFWTYFWRIFQIIDKFWTILNRFLTFFTNSWPILDRFWTNLRLSIFIYFSNIWIFVPKWPKLQLHSADSDSDF